MDDLRKRAESRLEGEEPEDSQDLSPEEAARLIHELRTHQIELELQNEELRKAQEELTEARDQFAELYEHAPVGYLTLSAKGLILQANLTGTDLLGAARSALVGLPLSSLVAPEDQDAYYLHLRETLGSKGRYTCELRMVTADGHERWARMESTASQDGPGGKQTIRCALSDIGERKLAEEAVRENEVRYRGLFETVADAVMVFDAETRQFVDLNEVACRLYGYTREEFLDLKHEAITAEPEASESSFRQTLRGELDRIPIRHHRKKDGTVFPVEIAASTLQLGGRTLLCGVVRDITERLATEEALRASRSFARGLIDSSMDMIVSVDGERRITEFNPAAEETFGYRREEVLGKHIDLLYADREGGAEISRTILSDDRYRAEALNRRKDGEEFPAIVSGSILRDAEGNEIGVMGISRDVAEQKQAEEDLRRARDEAQRHLDIAGVILMALDPQGGITLINRKGCEVLGYPQEDLIGRNWLETCVPPRLRKEVLPVFKMLMAGEDEPAEHHENPVLTRDGEERIIAWHNTVVRDESGAVAGTLSSGEDITERRRGEEEQRFLQELLRIANRHTEMRPMLDEFVEQIAAYIGCDAAALRILEPDGAIPYQAYRGLPPEFLERESPLSIRCDRCMCINVIKGETDPGQPFYSEGGSFFMNGTTSFLSAVPEGQKGQTRNVCNEFGYESVALIPVRLEGRITGLIHVADRKENMVPQEKVAVLEQAGLHLGAAIERVRLSEEVRRARDELEQRVAERTARLLESEESYRRLVEGSPAILYVFSDKRGGLFYSSHVEAVLGYSAEHLRGNPWLWSESIHPDDRPAVAAAMQAASEGQGFEVEYRVKRARGDWVWLHDRSLGTRREGEEVLIEGLAIDITARRRAEESARQLWEELAHVTRVSTMGELAASLAHELNQPLAAVVSNAGAALRFLASDSPDLEEVREALSDISEDARRAGEVIRSLRSLLKREGAARESLDMNQVAREILGLVRNDARLRGVTLNTELAEDLAPVLGDRVQLQQVLLNLLLNALDAVSRGEEGERQITVLTSAEEEGAVQLAVADTGAGLDEKDLDRIFEPFYTTKPEGLGMGLTVSWTIIDAHGGKLWAENSPDGGATFRVSLPAGS